MTYSFKDLQDQVMRVLDESASTSPTTLVLVKDFLNQSHFRRCTEFPWAFMIWPKEVTFSTVAGRQYYPLHEEFHRPLYIRNLTTGQYLMEVPNRELLEQGGDWTTDLTSSSATRFMYWGTSPVQRQPVTTSTVSIISSSTSDTGSKTVTITGELSSGAMTSETISLNGTTTATGSTAFQLVTDVTKSTATTGTVTVSLDSTAVLSLPPTVFGKQFRTIFIPDEIVGAETIGYRFYRQPRKLVNDYDIPLIPGPHSQILVYDTLIQMAAYLTESGKQTLGIWQEKMMAEQLAMYQAYAVEGQTIGGAPSYVHWTGGDDEYPRIVR